MSDFDAVCTVKREVSKDQFMRQLLIELASNYDTPYDVCTASFGEVRECEKEVIVCKAHVETEYSASVGYNRKEEYWDKEKKKNSSGGYYYVDVKKTRTVTDWSPYNGHASGDSVCMAFNESTSTAPLDENDRIVPVIKAIKSENMVEKGEASLSAAGLDKAKKSCIAFVEHNVTFPGDHVKDKRINSTADVQAIYCYKTPFYEVDFDYNGKKYSASGFACGEPNAESELPPNNVDIKGTVKKETKPWKIGIIAGWILVVAAFIVSCASYSWFWAIFAVLAVAAIAVTVIGNAKYNKRLRELQKDNKSKKLADLQAALEHYGYSQLTSDELASF